MLQKKMDVSWLSKQIMPYWGPSYSRDEVLDCMRKHVHEIEWIDSMRDWPEKAAWIINQGGIIAVFQ